MAVIKCKMCGGDLALIEGQSVAECEYCGSRQTVPTADNEKKLTLFARANRLRAACEFDKAAGIYEAIVAEFPEEAEAYWGLVLCKYGIEYVDDPATGKKIPTCHRSSFDSIMEDSDFEQALENADSVARRVYREEAKQIEEIRKSIIAVSNNEAPYDIFICYKETDENGDRTLDSVLAQDIYDALTEKGYRTFFARISLEDKLGQEYEPYIFAALNSAKIMLAVGTDYEFYNAVWVKNEWSRFLKLMTKDKSKHLIPCFKGIDAYDMPREFAKLQAQDLGKVGAIQDLLRGIEKILPKQCDAPTTQERVVITENGAKNVASLLKRGTMALEDQDWSKADEFFERVLDQDAECAEAYLGKAMASACCSEWKQLAEAVFRKGEAKSLKRAREFADEKMMQQFAQLDRSVDELRRIAEEEKNKQEEAEYLKKKRQWKKSAYKAYEDEFRKKQDTQIKEKSEEIRKFYATMKTAIQREQDEAVRQLWSQRQQMEATRCELERHRDSLGFFKRKEKEALNQKIADVVSRYHAMPTEDTVRAPYQKKLVELQEAENAEIEKAVNEIRKANPMISFENFQLDTETEEKLRVQAEKEEERIKHTTWYSAAKRYYGDDWEHFTRDLLPILEFIEFKSATVTQILDAHPREDLTSYDIIAFIKEDGMKHFYKREMRLGKAYFSLSLNA